ncbi:hypothetical protein [Pseudomonas umsongensis]|uniref:Uncharacterized protein n=1 Tax=Pseudomonas umsongensis TaxID=198618 RepID=A0AAE7DDW4_9PSED|nr:hypothetical protein [Pseudomonas umsongensis]QJC78914.1 hypothetical protein HGP31_11535 [Pseudomonas umsongensis]
MDSKEGAAIIDALAESIRSNPGQFVIQLKVVGQSFVTNGGIGAVISATGGAAGSTTIGNQVRVDGSSVDIAQGVADKAVVAQMNGLAEGLAEISRQLTSANPNKGLVAEILDSFKNSWVPTAITAVVSTVTTGLLGV